MSSQINYFIEGPIALICKRVALSVVVVIGTNGALAAVDALFIGRLADILLVGLTAVVPKHLAWARSLRWEQFTRIGEIQA